MPVKIKTLRFAFVAIAAILMAVVIGFYAYARYRLEQVVKDIPKRLGVDVQQTANGFKISKSEGGRMLFSISAGSAVQYKGNQHAALHDARIVVYNRGKGTSDPKTDIYDQIYGKEFDYDHATGEVRASGDVMIDLQGKGVPPQDPTDTTAAVSGLHLKTSGLSFNEKTGIARTNEAIEFALPQGSGSAKGAVYDSKAMKLHLNANVQLKTIPTVASKKKSGPVTVTATEADIADDPRQAVLQHAHIEDPEQHRSVVADKLTVELNDDDTIGRALASGNVDGSVSDEKSGATAFRSSQVELLFGGNNVLKTAVLTGAVKMDSRSAGSSEMHASAGRAVIDFGAKNQLNKIRATQSVALSNTGEASRDSFQLFSNGADFWLGADNRLQRAVTVGAAQVVMDSRPSSTQKTATHTVATADDFEALFAATGAAKSHMESVHGMGNTKVVSSSAGNPDRVTTGRDLLVKFDAKTGGPSTVDQSGDFKYLEGPRKAWADKARLDMAHDLLTLTGSPRIQDQTQGFTLTAITVKMNRKTGDIDADGDIKTTFIQQKADASSGAMFSGQNGEPVHATSQRMTANKASGVAKFVGNARLWQGANLLEAPQITFDKDKRKLTADAGLSSSKTQQVQTAFVQTDKRGKVTPVSVIAGKLVYSDNDRKAHFEGGVRLRTEEMTMVAEHVDVFLKGRTAQSGGGVVVTGPSGSASQVDRIEAEGKIVIQEKDPVRRITGSHLIYTSDEAKFVITGEPGKSPSIFDAERGDLTGDSLTFYTHDDRVQVGSGENSRVVTRTRIKDERKP